MQFVVCVCVCYADLDGSIEWFRSTHLTNGASWSHRSRRLLILVPLDASISHKLEDEDDNIRFYGNLPNCEMDRAGVQGRVYKHSVYRVYDQNGEVGGAWNSPVILVVKTMIQIC